MKMPEENNDMIPQDPGKNIPPSLEKHLSGIIQEKNLHQFRDQLPAEFLSDASEGLRQVQDARQLESVLKQLNQQMHHQLVHNKSNKQRRVAGNLSSTYWAIFIILFLTIIGFIVIRMFLHQQGS